MYMTWLENGVVNVDWWDEHNGAGTITTVDGATDYGDQGIFSNASSSSGVTEPAAETPFAPYYGIADALEARLGRRRDGDLAPRATRWCGCTRCAAPAAASTC